MPGTIYEDKTPQTSPSESNVEKDITSKGIPKEIVAVDVPSEPPSADSPELVLYILKSVDLEQFFLRIRDDLLVTQLAHFEFVEPSDLENINMSKPAIRRLLAAVTAHRNGIKSPGTATEVIHKAGQMWIPVIVPHDMNLVSGLGDSRNEFAEIPADIADLARLRPFPSEHNLIIYKRDEYLRLMEKMHAVLDEKCDVYAVGAHHTYFITGPPGSGKSCGAFSFAVKLACDPDKNWRIRWVRVPDRANPGPGVCLDFLKQDGLLGIKKTFLYEATSTTARCLLEDIRCNEQVFVFIDGYRQNTVPVEFTDQFLHWRGEDVDHGGAGSRKLYTDSRKLVVISSMECNLSKTSNHGSVPKYAHCTWKLDDFIDALKHVRFFESVKPILKKDYVGTGEFTLSDAEEVVRRKYEKTGDSIRSMFFKTTEDVLNSFHEALHILQGRDDIGANKDSFCASFSRLFGLTRKGDNSEVCYISSYVAEQLHRSVSAKRIKEICRLYTFGDSRMVGLYFEWWVIAVIREGRRDSLSGRKNLRLIGPEGAVEWECGIPLIHFTMKDMSAVKGCSSTNFWMVPLSRFQPAFDLVYISTTERLIRFIQITVGSYKGSVKIDYLRTFVTSLTSLGIFGMDTASLDLFPADSVEFYYLIPVGSSLKCDTNISGLNVGTSGWPEDLSEIRTPVLEIDDWI